MPPLPPHQYEYQRIQPPRSARDLPRFLRELLGGFFTRLFYTFSLVWESGPIYLFLMFFIALFNGLMPLVGALPSEIPERYEAFWELSVVTLKDAYLSRAAKAFLKSFKESI